MRTTLFITCFNDMMFPRTGRAVTELLERLGHTVEFPQGQTCCGQMQQCDGRRAYEGALHPLAQAYGGQTGDRFGWLENTYFGSGDDYGFGTPFDTGYNGTGFWTFAQAHLGTGTTA